MRTLLKAVALAVVVAAASGASAAPAGLVVAVDGDVSPVPEMFSEAEEGAVFRLAADAEMIIMHYAACVESHVRGGEVTVGPLKITTTGERVADTEIECPRKVAFADEANAVAAVVLRGGEDRTVINARPVFVFTRDGAEMVEVLRGGEILRRLKIAGQVARWPDGAEPLAPGNDYEIAVIDADRRRVAAAAVATDAGVTIVEP